MNISSGVRIKTKGEGIHSFIKYFYFNVTIIFSKSPVLSSIEKRKHLPFWFLKN